MLSEELGSLADETVVMEVNFVFNGADERTGMLITSPTPFPVNTLGTCPTLQVIVAVVLAATAVVTEQFVPELGTVHPESLQETWAKLALRLPFRMLFGTVNTEVMTALLAVGELRLTIPAK